jgi:glycerophosphoryl diester phosphodiesterase
MARPLVIAHRGASLTHPENTLPAIEAAIALGADVIELDVHASADGIAVLMHDRELGRTTGRPGVIDAFTAAELARLDAGGVFSGSGAGVPQLADAVAAIADTDVTLCLEFKDGEYRAPDIAAAWLVAQFDRFGLHGRAVANLPAPAIAAEVRRRDPRIRLVVDCERRPRDARQAAEIAAGLAATGAHAVEYEHSRVTVDAVVACRRLGMPVWAWTANDPADWDRLRAAGVDAILTDDPGGLLRHLGRQ